MKVVVATGGFDPVHSGHIAFLTEAKALGDLLVVGVNSDEWLIRKKGQAFMSVEERCLIVGNLKSVSATMTFDDSDGTAISLLHRIQKSYPWAKIIFANGGDRGKDNTPESVVNDVTFVYGVGGSDKTNSSSWILREWKEPKTVRPWGYYRILQDGPGCKVKELVVEPGRKLSMQRHADRSEHWFVSEGVATVNWDHGQTKILKHASEIIHKTEWHQLSNDTDAVLKIIEVQYGDRCDESDIERR